MFSPPYSRRLALTAMLSGPCSHHHALAAMLSPPRSQDHALPAMLPPPCSHPPSLAPLHSPPCFLPHALAAMLSGPCSQGHALTAMCTPVRWTRCTPARCTLGSFITANQQNLERLYSCKLDSGQGGSDLEDPKFVVSGAYCQSREYMESGQGWRRRLGSEDNQLKCDDRRRHSA